MKKFLTLMLGVTISMFVFTGCKKKTENITSDTPIEASTNETTPSETNKDESNNSKPLSKEQKNLEEIRKKITQNKSKITSGDKDDIDPEYLEHFVHIDNRFGMHYFAPEDMWLLSKKDHSEYYNQVAEIYKEPFFESSDVEFVCTSKDGSQAVFMIINKLRNSKTSIDQMLNSHGNRNIGGKNFIDASNNDWRIYCTQIGDYVITISTTSDSLLSGFTN